METFKFRNENISIVKHTIFIQIEFISEFIFS